MREWTRGHVWEASSSLNPQLISASEHMWKPRKISQKILIPTWALDCDFLGSFRCRLGRNDVWRERVPNVLHLYPANVPFWEASRVPLSPKSHGAYITFLGGSEVGLKRFILRPFRYARFLDPESCVKSRLQKIAEIGSQEGNKGFWKAQAVFFEILSILHSAIHVKGETYRIQKTEGSNSQTDFVRSVQEHFDRHIADSVRIKSLPDQFHMSLSAFALRYNKEAGETPMETLTRKRINLAKGLLMRGHSLKDIAIQAGFCDPFHLSKTFKRVVGMSPRTYVQACVRKGG